MYTIDDLALLHFFYCIGGPVIHCMFYQQESWGRYLTCMNMFRNVNLASCQDKNRHKFAD